MGREIAQGHGHEDFCHPCRYAVEIHVLILTELSRERRKLGEIDEAHGRDLQPHPAWIAQTNLTQRSAEIENVRARCRALEEMLHDFGRCLIRVDATAKEFLLQLEARGHDPAEPGKQASAVRRRAKDAGEVSSLAVLWSGYFALLLEISLANQLLAMPECVGHARR